MAPSRRRREEEDGESSSRELERRRSTPSSMAPSRRRREEEDGESSSRELERRRRRRMRLGVKMEKFLPRLRNKPRPFTRIEMRKEVKRLLRKLKKFVQKEFERFFGNSGVSNQGPKEVEGLVGNPLHSKPRYLLKFQKDLPEVIYTYNTVKAKDDEDVEIAIFDTVHERIVTSAPLSSAKVKVVVLYGNFGANVEESWSQKEFRDKIVKSAEGKELQLSGNFVINLNRGVGRLKGIEFRENPSCWTDIKEFKLGLMLHQNEDEEVREGISSCFTVKDRRSKGHEKHHPPSPTDEVYYLEGIWKNGQIHKRLLNADISNVQELLQVYSTNPDYLRMLLGSNNRAVDERTWKKITKHACECHPGDERQQVSVENLRNSTIQIPDTIQLSEPPVVNSILNPPQQTFCSSAQEMTFFSWLTSFLDESEPSLVTSNVSCGELLEDLIDKDWHYIFQRIQGKSVDPWIMIKFVINIKKIRVT